MFWLTFTVLGMGADFVLPLCARAPGRRDRHEGDSHRIAGPRASRHDEASTAKIIKKRTLTRKAAFLAAIRDHCSISNSARRAGIDCTTHYEWMARDEKYKAEFYLAVQRAKDAAFDDLVHRGMVGVFKPIIYRGDFCY